MNVLPTFLLLAILTLIAYRHVHAYRIAKRRRGGRERASNRHSTADSSRHIPPCDPNSCCGPAFCLKYMLQQERICLNQGQIQTRRKRGSLLPRTSWPFFHQSPEDEQRFPGYGPIPSSFHDKGLLKLTEEQEFIARTYYGRYFKRREQLPPLPSEMVFYGAHGPVTLPEGAMGGVRKKRTVSQVCPRSEEWQDIIITVNADDQLVQMVQLDDLKQWVLEERCQGNHSPIIDNVACVETTRLVPAIVLNTANSGQIQHEFIKVHCCVAVQYN